jgi:hypothetical protein
VSTGLPRRAVAAAIALETGRLPVTASSNHLPISAPYAGKRSG